MSDLTSPGVNDELRQRIAGIVYKACRPHEEWYEDYNGAGRAQARKVADAVLAVRDEDRDWYRRQANALAQRVEKLRMFHAREKRRAEAAEAKLAKVLSLTRTTDGEELPDGVNIPVEEIRRAALDGDW